MLFFYSFVKTNMTMFGPPLSSPVKELKLYCDEKIFTVYFIAGTGYGLR